MISVEQERSKYERMWAVKEYRANSPGEHLVPYFLDAVPWKKGESLIDLGCGTGRAGLKLKAHGFDVTLLDLCESALDDPARDLPFIEANLWDLPLLIQYDWFYCTDVMEHIPPEHVDDALNNISLTSSKGGFFQIAMFPEAFGDYIGETLHLTIQNSDWWSERLKRYWRISSAETRDHRLMVVVKL